MENETSIIGVEKRIRGRVKTQMEKTQREYYLNEQLKAIQKELGEIEDGKDETTSLNKAITKAKMPKEVEKKCLQELKKLKNMSPMSAGTVVIRAPRNGIGLCRTQPPIRRGALGYSSGYRTGRDFVFVRCTACHCCRVR